MNKKNIIILTSAIIIFIIAIIFFIWTFKNTQNKSKVNDINTIQTEEVSKTKDLEDVSYLDFTFYKEDRSEVKLSEFKDSAVMILFWNSDNEDSVEVLKKVNSMYEEYSNAIKFLMINTSDKIDENLKNEVSLEIYYDLYKEGALKYNVTELPSMIYISKDNKVFNAKSGFTTTDALEANLDILSENF